MWILLIRKTFWLCPSGHFSQKNAKWSKCTAFELAWQPRTDATSWKLAKPKDASVWSSNLKRNRRFVTLKKDQDIKRVFAKGKSVYDDLCGIKFCSSGLPESRFAIVVGTKVAKTAVARNRLKRQIRAILAKNKEKTVSGFDVIVLTKTPAIGKTSSEIASHLLRTLEKAKMLKKWRIFAKIFSSHFRFFLVFVCIKKHSRRTMEFYVLFTQVDTVGFIQVVQNIVTRRLKDSVL